MSKNIVYYHGIIWPILLYLGCQGTENFEIQIAVKGFLNIKDSNNDLVDIDKALSMYDKDYLRFYVTYVVKDNITDFKFELSEFKNLINSVLCKNIGGFYKRCRNILYKYNIEKVPDIEYRDAQFDDLIQLYKKQYKNMESYKLLMDALIYIKHCGKEIELNKIYNYPTIENIGLLCFMIQAGDPESKNAPKGKMLGAGDVGYTIPAEFVYPKYFHKKGALSAARQGDNVNPKKESSGCQFYIVTGKVYNDL